MGAPTKTLWTAIAVCLLICAVPARALASTTEQSILMDDDQFIYSQPSHVIQRLEQLKTLGVDRLKVSVVWSLVVPSPNSKQVPHFNATDPAAYPPFAWERYDLLAREASRLGIELYFQITPPAPAWALAHTKPTQGYTWSQRPSAALFGKFVQAVGRRYSGAYAPPLGPGPIPRVSFWGIWNEPNEGAWLNPQWRTVRHRAPTLVAPVLYRGLVDAAYRALRATSHGRDTILIGETASHGWIYPIPFLRALYCVGANDQPLRGAAARALRCPGSRAAFVAHHPGLFASTVAHHPYSFDVPPTHVISRNLITLANLGSLERSLNRIFAAYRRKHRAGVPMYLTEWGYKTNPPNPFVRTSLTQQATWLNQGEYMTWKFSYVRALDQFLLVDDGPRAEAPRGSRAYWGTFQSGLLFAGGAAKPSLAAFRIPIWLPRSSHRHLTVWGELRAANHSLPQTAILQYQPRGSSAWVNAQMVRTANREGFLLVRTSVSGPGSVRLAWLDPAAHQLDYSRVVGVS